MYFEFVVSELFSLCDLNILLAHVIQAFLNKLSIRTTSAGRASGCKKKIKKILMMKFKKSYF